MIVRFTTKTSEVTNFDGSRAMENALTSDVETPRTLLTSVLQHTNPVETVRRPGRRSNDTKLRRLRKRPSISTRLNKASRLSTSSSLSLRSRKSTETEATPRGLISNALKQQNVQKTLRVALRQNHPTVLLQLNGEKINSESEKSQPGSSVAETDIPTIDSTVQKKKDETTNTSQLTVKKANRSQWSNVDDDELSFHRKARQKRIRLSDINLSKVVDTAELSSFTDDLVSKVQALIKKNKENTVAHGIIRKGKPLLDKKHNRYSSPQLSSTRITSFFEPSRKDALTNTFSVNESVTKTFKNHQTKSAKDVTTQDNLTQLSQHATVLEKVKEEPPDDDVLLDEIIVPSTTSYSDSDIAGPLDLSKISAGSQSKEIYHNEQELDAVNNIQNNSSSRISNKTPTTFQDNQQNSILKSHYVANNSDIWPDSVLQSDADADKNAVPQVSLIDRLPPQLDVQTKGTNDDQDLTVHNASGIRGDIADSVEVAQEPAEISLHKKTPAKRKKVIVQKKPPYQLPFPRSQLSGIVQHYSTLKMSKEALKEIEEVSRHYFKDTVNQLENICHKRKAKAISTEDVVRLMKSRGHLTRKKTLDLLVEENFSLEYREELIQVAIAGNKVLP